MSDTQDGTNPIENELLESEKGGKSLINVPNPQEKVVQEVLDDEKVAVLLEAYKKRIEKAKRDKFTFLLIGRTGVGKSSSVNSLMGKEVAPVGDWVPTTMSVTSYDNDAFGIKFTVIDTPGLCDDLEEEGKDYKYLKRMQEGAPQFDCLWFVTPLYETRVTSDEKRAIKLITQAYGKDVWQHAVIVFTFANALRPDMSYSEASTKRTELIRREIARWTTSQISAKVPSVAIDNKSKTTPDGEEWLGELYVTVFTRISDQGFLSFLLATATRLEFEAQSKPPIPVPTPTYNSYSSYSYSSHSSSIYTPSTHNTNYTPPSPQTQSPPPPPTPPNDKIRLNPSQQNQVTEKTQNFFQRAAPGVVGGAALGAAIGSFGGPIGAVIGGLAGGVIGGILSWGRGK